MYVSGVHVYIWCAYLYLMCIFVPGVHLCICCAHLYLVCIYVCVCVCVCHTYLYLVCMFVSGVHLCICCAHLYLVFMFVSGVHISIWCSPAYSVTPCSTPKLGPTGIPVQWSFVPSAYAKHWNSFIKQCGKGCSYTLFEYC